MPSRLNQLMAAELQDRLSGMDTCVFVDFTGISGRQTAVLRNRLRETCGANTRFSVVKTSLAKKALAEMESTAPHLDGKLAPCLAGPTAVVYGADDPVVLARTLEEWITKEKNLQFKGGLLAGQPMAAESVARLAKIPPRPVLLAQVIGTLSAPITNMLGLAQGPIRKLLGLAEALGRKASEPKSE